MQAVAELLDESSVVQEMGRIRGAGDELTVETSRGVYRARRATSCLVDPVPDDRVLVVSSAAGEAFVLAVLERPGDEPLELRADRDLRIKLPSGRFVVAAADGVDLVSPKEINIVTGELEVNAQSGSVFFEKLAYLGTLANVDVEKVRTVAGVLEQVVDRISQKVKRSYRFVEEVDLTRANEIDMRAKENVHVRGHNALMTAEVLVKMDAKQIHLG